MALALILRADDVSGIDLIDLLVATDLITQVPSDSTIHRRHQELANLGDDVRTPLMAAMKTIRTGVWNKIGPRSPAASATVDNSLVIDLGVTEITAHSNKELTSATRKKHFKFHPLRMFINLGDDHVHEVFAIKLLPGNAGANTVADHLAVLDTALAPCRITSTASPGVRGCSSGRTLAAARKGSSNTSSPWGTVI